MDELIEKAQVLVAQSLASYIPVAKRIAYVVSHGQSYASNGYAIRTQGVAKALNDHGFEALCFVRPGRPWELGVEASGVKPEVIVDGVKYIHSRWRDGVPSSEIGHLECSVEQFVLLFQIYRPEVVLAASNYIVGLPAWVAATRLNIPFCNEVRGFWELSREAREPGYKQQPAYKTEAERDVFVAKQAIGVITLNQFMKDELIRRGINENCIEIAMNGVSRLPALCMSRSTELRDALQIGPQDKVVTYIGSLNRYEGLEDLIHACEDLVAEGEKLKLVLVGSVGPIKNHDTPMESLLPWLIQTGRIDHQKVSEYFALADLVVIPRRGNEVCRIVPPMKAVEALAHKCRMLVSDVQPLKEIASLYTGIMTFPADSLNGLKAAIRRALLTSLAPSLADIDSITFSRTVTPMVRMLSRLRQGELAGQTITSAKTVEADLQEANQLFYRQGKISPALRILESLHDRGVKFDKSQRDFLGVLRGLMRLQRGWHIPPRQPNSGVFTRRRHLLYCLHQSVPHTTNGYSTRSHGIAVGLQQAGWNVRSATRPGFPWDAGVVGLSKGYHEEIIDGITYVSVAGWNLNKTPLDHYLAEAADLFLREAQTSGAEVIVAASNHITALSALVAARRLGLPFVYEVRGLWEVTQASVQPEWAESERFHLMRTLESQVAGEADLLITLTEELADELVVRGAKRENIIVVPNAVDTDRFYPREPDNAIMTELGLNPDIPVIGYAGSAVAYEGLNLLLDALHNLKVQGVAFQFVLVGDGKVMEEVKNRARELCIEEYCRFTGRIPFDQVPSYLSCMDIMPIPRLSSAVTEMVSPLKPLEAMAMGKAVVLSDVSPHKIFAGNNVRARLFEKDSVVALADVLKELMADPQQRKSLGDSAKAWIESQRTWEKVARDYSNSIALCIESLPPTPSGRKISEFTIGLIADQFTTDTLASAVTVVPISLDSWQQEVEQHNIDVFFLESAWKGNEGQWHNRVGYYSEEEFEPLRALLGYCRERGIPSIFWNKEDPVHFDRFRRAAALCDHVFTTDSRRIIPYLSNPNAQTVTASSCPFYASPKIHNLLPSTRKWSDTVAYGGTYYGDRYPERTEYMDKIMSAAAPLGLTIYDRQHDDPASPYKYPDGLGAHVAGSLEYSDMIEAYKAHPAQINVNSVLDSPTMFSRRVIEVAASGVPVISGPALGMNRYLEGAGLVINTETEAAQALENLKNSDAYRWRLGLKAARAVMRAHTTEYRLVQMLRTAGLIIEAAEPPDVTVSTELVTKQASLCLLNQTLLPRRVVAKVWAEGTKTQLADYGIECLTQLQPKIGEAWLLATTNALENLYSEDIEDLAWAKTYSPHSVIGFNRETAVNGNWPGIASSELSSDSTLRLVTIETSAPTNVKDLAYWVENQSCLAVRKPIKELAHAPNNQPEKTLLIAGHDLKFIKPFYPYFTKAGFRILLDFWDGHNKHNEAASKRLIQQADTIFCEWMLGNAIWYGKHKKPEQRLVGRLHLQEIDHALFPKTPYEVFSKVIFVGPHILRRGIEKNSVLKENGVVIYNGVDVGSLQAVPRTKTNGKVLGFVGMVPQRKRVDLALDILRELRRDDKEYALRIKGKRPEEFPWMENRPEELTWYMKQYQRILNDPLLMGAVFFDSHGNDMPEWYAGIDFVLSTSDFESFHFSIADGAIAGAIPVVLPWEGADEIYPLNWIGRDVDGMVDMVKNPHTKDVSQCSNIIVEKFSIDLVAERIVTCIKEEV